MLAVVVDEPGRFSVQEVPKPKAQAGEVLVEVKTCGLCGTDVHIAHGQFPASPYPITPGHEFAGVVVELGPGVDSLQLGDRVAVDPTLSCGACRNCREGHLNLCERWGAIGDTVAGGLAEYVAVPARLCYSLPQRMSWGEGALIEPLSCAVWAMKRLRVEPGFRALVTGGGTMGLLLAQLLPRIGAISVDVVEPNESRRAAAEEVGVNRVWAPAELTELHTIAPGGFDLVVDATGIPAVIEDGLTMVQRGGTFLIFGVAPATATTRMRPFDIYNGDLSIVGSMAVNQTFGAAVRLASTLQLLPLLAPPKGLGAYSDEIEHFGGGDRPKQQLVPGML